MDDSEQRVFKEQEDGFYVYENCNDVFICLIFANNLDIIGGKILDSLLYLVFAVYLIVSIVLAVQIAVRKDWKSCNKHPVHWAPFVVYISFLFIPTFPVVVRLIFGLPPLVFFLFGLLGWVSDRKRKRELDNRRS